ncbi:MAG TPA: hypothetical protein VG323_17435 [Thermoanaerobaculia bacterium]|nr:hypothetical protein [Thermoanaerobaculia bacterium]
MFGSDTLDVAIGLVFIYLMVSFVCSAATELIEVILKNRPRKLFQGIAELLSSSDEWVAKIYNDPLVSSLYKGKFADVKPRNLPSYIPSKNFAVAVLNQLDDNTSWDKINASVENLFPEAERTELKTLRDSKSTSPRLKILDVQEHIYKALKSALLTAEGDINKAVKNIEDWYNSAMDRVSGWFKRRTHVILLCLGAVAAMVYNIDTLSIVTRLANDKAVRQTVVASAGAAVSAQQSTTTTGTTDDVDAAKKKLDQTIATLFDKAGVLIGWNQKDFKWDYDYLRGQLWTHWLGWLLTAIAVSFGAPFWFDVLNKFMVVRSTVKPKEKSEPEKSKD